jgi:hypothetical protein
MRPIKTGEGEGRFINCEAPDVDTNDVESSPTAMHKDILAGVGLRFMYGGEVRGGLELWV